MLRLRQFNASAEDCIKELINAQEGQTLSAQLRWRQRLLYSYEHFYFKSLLRARKYSSFAKYLMLFGLVSILMSFDSKRYAMQYVFALIVMFFLVGYLSNKLRRPQKISVYRELPDRVLQGEVFEYFICVKNEESQKSTASFMLKDVGRVRFPTLLDWYILRAPFAEQLNAFDKFLGYPKWLYLMHQKQEILGSDVLVPALAPGELWRCKVKGMGQKRGLSHFVGFSAAIEDPFGLLKHLWFIEKEDTLLVEPKSVGLNIALKSGQSHKMGVDSVGFKALDLQDFRALRAWRPGDSIKHIDWRATARLNEPICKEFSSPQSFESVLVVQSWCQSALDVILLEKNIQKAFYLLSPRVLQEVPIGFVVTSGGTQGLSTERGYALALNDVASLEPVETSDLENLKDKVSQLQQECSSVILLLTQWDEKSLEWVQELQSHGLFVTVYISVAESYQKKDLPQENSEQYSVNMVSYSLEHLA